MLVDIDESVCPWLSDIPETELSATATNLLKLGHLVSTLTKINVDPEHSLVNTFKQELSALFSENRTYLSHVEKNIEESVGSLTQTVNKSSLKGKLGEHAIEMQLKEAFPDDAIENMASQANESDYHFHSTVNNAKFLIEVKTYSVSVNTAQIDKFYRDMDRTNLPVGIFVSTTSGITGHPRLSIEYINDNQLVIFIPNTNFESAPLIYAILYAKQHIGRRAVTTTENMRINREKILSLYAQFETSFNDISRFRFEIHKAKQTISTTMENLYKQAMDTEVRIKYLMEDTKAKIQKELSDKRQMNRSIEYDMSEFYERLRKANDKRLPYYKLLEDFAKTANIEIRTSCANGDDLKWEFFSNSDANKKIGELKYTKTRVDFVVEGTGIMIPVNEDTIEYLAKIIQ